MAKGTLALVDSTSPRIGCRSRSVRACDEDRIFSLAGSQLVTLGKDTFLRSLHLKCGVIYGQIAERHLAKYSSV